MANDRPQWGINLQLPERESSVKFESTLGFVSVDPSFDAVPFDETKHEGHVLYEGSGGSTWRTLTIDTVTLKLCNGDHRLFLRTGRPIGAGEGYGVFVVRFKVENSAARRSREPAQRRLSRMSS